MIPILFDRYTTNFTTNGIGRLYDCISCTVTEERNGPYELEFEYPITGAYYSYIEHGSIVYATHDDNDDPQPFRVYAHTKQINGIVTFYASHISYKLNDIVLEPFSASSCPAALLGFEGHAINENPFTFWTDKSTAAEFSIAVPTAARNALGGMEGSILDVYGGEYEWDKFTVKLHARRGTDTDVEIRFGKNLIDLTEESDSSGIFDGVVPYWYGEDDEGVPVLVTLPEQIVTYAGAGETVDYLANENIQIIQTGTGVDILVDGENINVVPLDLSDQFEEAPEAADLRSAAESYLNSANSLVPIDNLKVDFVQLWQTEEYAEYAPLQRVGLCDTVSIYFPELGVVRVRQKVVKTTYNVLLDRFDEIELGELQTSLGDVIIEGLDLSSYATASDVNSVQASLAALADNLQSQIDAKIETWYQSTDPSTSWTTADDKAAHNGDLWCYTGASTSTMTNLAIYRYGYDPDTQTGEWVEYDAASELFDEIDGKTTIYYGTPQGSYPNANTGDYLVDSTDGCTYRWNGLSWVKMTDYNAAIVALQQTLEAQIDAKIETWAQSSNPATAWTDSATRSEHDGDLWLYTGTSNTTVGSVTIHPQGVYQYNGTNNTWSAYSSTSNNLFDLADGKTTIFYGAPTGTYSNKSTGDYLVDSTDGCTYRWNGTSWIKQTDYNAAIASIQQSLEAQIDAKIETWAQSTNPANAWTTAAEREKHEGDLWCYTGSTTSSFTYLATYRFMYDSPSQYGWVQFDATPELFDEIDGKTTIFYGSPSGTYTGVQTGDYLVDSSTGCTYRWNGSSWVKQTDYAGAISSMQTVLENAITNATQKITGGLGGYVYMKPNANGYPEEILIMNTADVSTATKVWRWNINGLGYSNSGYNGPYTTAITMDGAIVADFITTGTLNANVIKAGVLSDVGGNTTFDLATGLLAMSRGSISLGGGLFSATDAGYITARSGKIGPFTIVDSTIEAARKLRASGGNGTISLGTDGLTCFRSGSTVSDTFIDAGGSQLLGQVIANDLETALYSPDESSVQFVLTDSDITMKPGTSTFGAAPNLYLGSTGLLRKTTGSSRQIKKNITDLKNKDISAENLYNLDVVQFKYNTKSGLDKEDQRFDVLLPGFILEQMDEVYPVAIDKNDTDDPKEWRWNQMYLIPPMVKLIQDQHKEIDELKEELAMIKERISQLEEGKK